MINERMQSLFTDYNVVNEPTLRVTVEFNRSRMVEALANVLVKEMFRVAGPAGDSLLSKLSVDDMSRYLTTLSWMRCVRVSGISNKVTQPYFRLMRALAVPVLWYQVLVGIGRAYDRDYSIEFIPGTSISESDLLAPEQMLAISDAMFNLQNNGLKIVAGIPSDEEGDLDFMAMAHVEETVLSYRKTHPVYGFLASFFATEEVSKALGALVRIKYGVDSDYQVMIGRVVASMGGGEI